MKPAPAMKAGGTSARALEEIRAFVRAKLEGVAGELTTLGIPRPALDGKILRPLAAYLVVPPGLREELDDRFWKGALAVEMVHEASLLHDDILDEAPERRGQPTLSASAGVGPALVHTGDGHIRDIRAVDDPGSVGHTAVLVGRIGSHCHHVDRSIGHRSRKDKGTVLC